MTPALRPRTRWQRLAKLAREEGVAVRVNQVTGEVTILPEIHSKSPSVPVDAGGLEPKPLREPQP